jgi:hypothetical protein
MQAGPELDALIADKIMQLKKGWIVRGEYFYSCG